MAIDMDNTINLVVVIFVGAIMAAALIPTALVFLYNTTFTTFVGNATVNATVQTVPLAVVALYNTIGIAITIGVIVLFFKMAGKI